MSTIRHDWSLSEIEGIYTLPLTELVYRAATVHRQFHAPNQVQGCMLLSIKTGGCPEDCGYCPQSARYDTHVEHQPLMPLEETLEAARAAKAASVEADVLEWTRMTRLEDRALAAATAARWPNARCSLALCLPSSNMSPSTATLRPRH